MLLYSLLLKIISSVTLWVSNLIYSVWMCAYKIYALTKYRTEITIIFKIAPPIDNINHLSPSTSLCLSLNIKILTCLWEMLMRRIAEKNFKGVHLSNSTPHYTWKRNHTVSLPRIGQLPGASPVKNGQERKKG